MPLSVRTITRYQILFLCITMCLTIESSSPIKMVTKYKYEKYTPTHNPTIFHERMRVLFDCMDIDIRTVFILWFSTNRVSYILHFLRRKTAKKNQMFQGKVTHLKSTIRVCYFINLSGPFRVLLSSLFQYNDFI